MSNNLLAGKRGLIMGVANHNSIAWGAAKALAAQGAEIALTYQGEAFGRRVRPLAEEIGSTIGAVKVKLHRLRRQLLGCIQTRMQKERI